MISDLFGSRAEIVMSDLRGQVETKTVSELLPAPFDRSVLR